MTTKALLQAAQAGDVAALRAALASGTPVDPVPEGQDSPLVLAVMFEHREAAEVLLDAGARLDHRGARGSTALHAAACRSLELTQLLVSRGANVNARNGADDSVLDAYLFSTPHRDPGGAVVDVLLAAGFDLTARGTRSAAAGRSPLTLACSVLHRPSVERLLAAGLELNEGEPPGSVIFGQLRHVQDHAALVPFLAWLVERGLNPNASDRLFERTLLGEACRFGALELARLLLAKGADVNPPGRRPPLVIAEDGGHSALIDLLLEHGAQPTQPGLSREAQAALAKARGAAEAAPGDAASRLAYARALASAGLRAAAAAESFAAAHLGAQGTEALRESLSFEGGEGVRWRFVEGAPGLAPAVPDARFPGARVTDGAHVVPLVLALCPPCTECDAERTMVCSQCGGSGSRPGFLDPDDTYDCDPRVPCTGCGQTRFFVNAGRRGRGRCLHPAWAEESKNEWYTLSRCTACGLSRLATKVFSELLPCGLCARYVCGCDEAQPASR